MGLKVCKHCNWVGMEYKLLEDEQMDQYNPDTSTYTVTKTYRCPSCQMVLFWAEGVETKVPPSRSKTLFICNSVTTHCTHGCPHRLPHIYQSTCSMDNCHGKRVVCITLATYVKRRSDD